MINVALCGYGTIGHGVKALLEKEPLVYLSKVLDLPTKKAELGDLLVTDYRTIVEDPSINVVIECMGGDALPYPIITASLKAGKAVISSNKETISKHYKEYASLAQEHHAALQFEASVGGGIPLLYPLNVLATFDSVALLRGIMNGTTNFILTEVGKGSSFDAALKEAQAKGFAEKDPTADLEGLDLIRKAAILAMLLFHKEVNVEEIPHFGISHLSENVLALAQKEGRVLKMIVDIHPYQNGLSILVAPTLLKAQDPLANVLEETNAVSVEAKANGPLTFIGKGAGEFPTASAMISDLERVVHQAVMPIEVPLARAVLVPDLRGRFYAEEGSGRVKTLENPSLEELKKYVFIAKVAE
jgi:homoserine dehydrogenase